MFKIKKPGIGFYLMAASFVLAVVALVMYFLTFSAFNYLGDRYVIALMVIVFWCMAFLIVNALFSGNKPVWVDIFYLIAIMALVIAAIKFITPCLSPIGIYFTVHNMGDVEANAIGVPRSIVGIIIFLSAIACFVASAFFNAVSAKESKV